ncbi:hypothetical protein Trydic_g5536, partial [Trypoxylus dichotomus]
MPAVRLKDSASRNGTCRTSPKHCQVEVLGPKA